MKTPVEHAKSIVRTSQLLYDDIRRISENKEWDITEVHVSPLDIAGVFRVYLSADSESQFTWADIKQIERVIQEHQYPIECVVMMRMDVSYDDDFDIDEYEEVLVQNGAFRNHEDGTADGRCFDHPEGRCPINDVELWYSGRFRLDGTDVRDIAQYASDPIAMEIVRTVSAETGCLMDDMPEVTPITPEEITQHVREIKSLVYDVEGGNFETLDHRIKVVLSGDGDTRKRFCFYALSALTRYEDFTRQLDKDKRMLWSLYCPHILEYRFTNHQYTHTHDVIGAKRLTMLYDHYFKGYDEVEVVLTDKLPARLDIQYNYTSNGAAQVIILGDDYAPVATCFATEDPDGFLNRVRTFLQDFGSCACY